MLKFNDFTEKNNIFLDTILPLDTVVRELLIPCIFLVGIFAYIYGVSYPLWPLGMIVAAFIIVSGIGIYVIRKGLMPGEVVYFVLLLIDAALVTAALYYSGGVESSIQGIYAITGVLGALALPFWGVIGLTATIIVFYLAEISLETMSAIPHINIFPEFFRQSQYPDSGYIRIDVLFNIMIMVALIAVAYIVADRLRKKKEYYEAMHFDLDKSAKLLVRRDLELNELNQQLDAKVMELEQMKIKLEDKIRKGEEEGCKFEGSAH